MKSEKFDWRIHLKEALERTDFMALSTLGKDGSWTNPVYFSYDENMNLYFKSMPTSKHMKNITENPNVSIAIFSTNWLPEDDVVGIQLTGKAVILNSKNDVEKATKYHYGRSQPETDYKKKIEEHLGKEVYWNFVKVIPNEMWLFDTRHFDE